MDEADSEFYLVLAGRQAPRFRAGTPVGESSSSPVGQISRPEPPSRPSVAEVPAPPTDSKGTVLSVKMKEATCVALAQAAKAAGKSHRLFIAELLAAAGVAVHPEDLKNRPKLRLRV